jgi:hypothetical protein
MQGVPMDARRTGGRIGWWFRRGPLVLAIVLGAALYAAVVAKAQFGLPLDVQLALFEGQHGILWVDSPSTPNAVAALKP